MVDKNMTWEQLVEWVNNNIEAFIDDDKSYFAVQGIHFFNNGNILIYSFGELTVIATNRTPYQIYNIIKNLTEE